MDEHRKKVDFYLAHGFWPGEAPSEPDDIRDCSRNVEQMKSKCDHIIGLGSTAEDQTPRLVLNSQIELDAEKQIVVEKDFQYCPKCGRQLWEDG